MQLSIRTSTPLALGAVAGGLIGKWLFELVRRTFENESTLGLIQAVLLSILNILVFIYICKKDKLKSYHTESIPVALIIGLALGMISSFLGIGGGPCNVAVLFLFFSMGRQDRREELHLHHSVLSGVQHHHRAGHPYRAGL